MRLDEEQIQANRDRFLRLVRIGADNECWFARGVCFHLNFRRTISVARFGWMLFCGVLEPWEVLIHKCGNRQCVNPAHKEKREFPLRKKRYLECGFQIQSIEELKNKTAQALRLLKECGFRPLLNSKERSITLIRVPRPALKSFWGTWKHV